MGVDVVNANKTTQETQQTSNMFNELNAEHSDTCNSVAFSLIYLVNVVKKSLHGGKTVPKSNRCGSFRRRKFDSNQQFANCLSTTHFSDTVTAILEFAFEIT